MAQSDFAFATDGLELTDFADEPSSSFIPVAIPEPNKGTPDVAALATFIAEKIVTDNNIRKKEEYKIDVGVELPKKWTEENSLEQLALYIYTHPECDLDRIELDHIYLLVCNILSSRFGSARTMPRQGEGSLLKHYLNGPLVAVCPNIVPLLKFFQNKLRFNSKSELIFRLASLNNLSPLKRIELITQTIAGTSTFQLLDRLNVVRHASNNGTHLIPGLVLMDVVVVCFEPFFFFKIGQLTNSKSRIVNKDFSASTLDRGMYCPTCHNSVATLYNYDPKLKESTAMTNIYVENHVFKFCTCLTTSTVAENQSVGVVVDRMYGVATAKVKSAKKKRTAVAGEEKKAKIPKMSNEDLDQVVGNALEQIDDAEMDRAVGNALERVDDAEMDQAVGNALEQDGFEHFASEMEQDGFDPNTDMMKQITAELEAQLVADQLESAISSIS